MNWQQEETYEEWKNNFEADQQREKGLRRKAALEAQEVTPLLTYEETEASTKRIHAASLKLQQEKAGRYTIETLTPINQEFTAEHYHLTEKDVAIANDMVELIEERRQGTPAPQDGDLLICERTDGTIIRKRAHLEAASWVEAGELAVCRDVYAGAPHISKEGYTTASGGPWFRCKPDELTYIGTDKKRFWTWGRIGAIAHGGINFDATVNVWKLVSDKIY